VRLPLPEDPSQRLFAIAVVCSILLHILLLGLFVGLNSMSLPLVAKRGEPLIVDIAPEKPEEKAPLGNPARPPSPPPSEPAPRAAPAPPPTPPAPPKAAPAPRPEPPRQVAKALPPPPSPPAKAPEPPKPAPLPEPQPAPQQAPPRETPPPAAAPQPQPQPAEAAKPQEAAPSGASSAGSPSANQQTALAKPSEPRPSIFRYPGGGGLHGGRGGSAGEPIPLDTPDPNYREYMEKVKQRIYAKWGYPYEAQTRGLQGKLVVEFHIAKDGHLQFIEMKASSGEDILDNFALTAVKLAQMYPPLPDAMQREVLPIVAIFVYTLRGPLSVLQSLQ